MTQTPTWVKHGTPVLVAGACGGAGATTTTLGLANVAAGQGITAVAIDATPAGGDLADRGADQVLASNGIEQLLASATGGEISDEAFMLASSHTATNARILHRAGDALANETDFRRIAAYLKSRRADAIYDLGHRIGARYLRSLVSTPGAAIVLAVPCRVDAFNRMRANLDAIGRVAGEAALKRTVVAISNQDANGWPVDVDMLRGYLEGRIGAIEQIPYDQHLASGIVIAHDALAPATVAAYEKLAEVAAELVES
ncbi:hypothetical protein [Rhodococcus sp. HNM0569]|uniref:hypothetical protein n=1 Tax=Rhodococcus sp. HNM0569 TaxID=2716340 RepID=UPI00146ECE4B|nr:hypothetical protein [Rhodococcus sp. HNM0569]NLU85009.1 hypothetical protein [Rhodococcus sp. HNM0569]